MQLVQSHLTSGRAGYIFMTHSLHSVKQRSLTCNFQAGQEFIELETFDMTFCTNLSGRAGHQIHYTRILTCNFQAGQESTEFETFDMTFIARIFQAGQDTESNT